MVYFVDGVLASGVEIILEMDYVHFALQELEIHSFMIQIQTLSMILQTTILHSPRHTRVSYVGTILTMVLIVHYGYRFFDQPTQTSIDHQPPKETSVRELLLQEKLHKALQSVCEKLNQQEQAANLSTHTPEPSRRFNFIYDDDDDEYDDDDEESTIPLNEITSQIPLELDEVIKSSVEDLVPIPSESEDTSDNDSECDFPFCNNPVTFSNPLFDSNNDFTSSDDESLPEEDVHEENFKIYSNPLFEFDDKYISIDVNPLFNEVLEDIESKDSKLDEPALLVTPLFDTNEDECFDPGGNIDEIEACLTSDSIPLEIDDANLDPEGDILLLKKLLSDVTSSPLPPKELYFEDLKVKKSSIDTPPDFKDDYYDPEGDIIYLESLLIKDTTHNLSPKVFLDIDPKSLNNEPDFLKSMVKVFDPEIHEKTFSPTYVKLPFEDRHYFFFTFAVRIFLPYLTYSVDSPFLFSFGSEDTSFDPDIFAFSFYALESVVSHQSGTFMCFNVYLNILNESPIEIFSSTCFVPNITMIWGESSQRLAQKQALLGRQLDCPDYEDSRARGFVHRSLEL
ncbi:hypothetical protein Tco_1178041 [Tanacetum coccineum]